MQLNSFSPSNTDQVPVETFANAHSLATVPLPRTYEELSDFMTALWGSREYKLHNSSPEKTPLDESRLRYFLSDGKPNEEIGGEVHDEIARIHEQLGVQGKPNGNAVANAVKSVLSLFRKSS